MTITVTLPDSDRYDSVGTLDIETTGTDAGSSELVAIGVGYYEPGMEYADTEVHTRQNVDGGEFDLIRTAYLWLNHRGPDCLTTYGGEFFDTTYLDGRLDRLPHTQRPKLGCRETHVDLFPPRQDVADDRNESWPSLEESLDAYDIPALETTWRDQMLDNTRFGEELAPRYLDALESGDTDTLADLEMTVYSYTVSDIEANIALYEADAGRNYTPRYAR